MGAVWNIARKDLLLLWRDKAGLFWVLGFPLLIALFFGSIFSSGGGPGPVTLGVVNEDQSVPSMPCTTMSTISTQAIVACNWRNNPCMLSLSAAIAE